MQDDSWRTAVSATLHCLTGCAIGEVLGMVLSTALGLSNALNIVLSVALAFAFGYTLTSLPLLRSGMPFKTVAPIALAADTMSITTMEIVDTLTIVLIPGAINLTLSDVGFWASLAVSLVIAFAAAVPVNRALIARGKGHAVVHAHHAH